MHFTYSEIKDQYNALARTANYVQGLSAGARKLYERAKPRSLVFFGCGSGYCIARSLALSAQMNLRIPALAIPAGDFMLHAEYYCPSLEGAMGVALSPSGCDTEVCAAVEHLKTMTGASAFSITCADGSALAGLCDFRLEMPWAAGQSVCQARADSSLYTAGLQLIAHLAGNDKLLEGLERAVTGGEEFLEQYNGAMKALASKGWTNVVLLADAELAGVAAQGALAIQNICRLPGRSYHLLETRHGPLAAIGSGTLVLAALTDGNLHELTLLADTAARGADIAVYSDIPLDGLPDAAVNIAFGKSLPHAARALPFLTAVQMLACHRAVADGLITG